MVAKTKKTNVKTSKKVESKTTKEEITKDSGKFLAGTEENKVKPKDPKKNLCFLRFE